MGAKFLRFLSEDHIYRDLTIALALVLGLSPLLTWLTGTAKVHGYLTIVFMLVALYEVTRRTSDVVIAVVLGLLAIGSGIVNAGTPDTPAINIVPTVLGVLFLGFLIWHVLRDVVSGERLTAERIFGAICAYLIIGFLFAEIYGFIALVDESAFAVSESLRARWAGGDADGFQGVLTYFSFVTMTTLGYGDISPVSPAARTFAWFQALVGQLYLAVTIAGLVGIHIAGRKE